MSEFTQRLQWARVEYTPEAAELAFGKLAMVNVPDAMGGPGLKGSDTVQVATFFAALRDVCASYDLKSGGPVSSIAAFKADGESIGVLEGGPEYMRRKTTELLKEKNVGMMAILGDAPFRATATHAYDWNPTPAWGKKLALSIDELLTRMGKSEQGGEVPPAFMAADFVTVAFPIPLLVIVTGAALAVIGSVAVWRYLDPDLRRDVLVVKQAAEGYAMRLGIWKQTGTMPPPSAVESDALETVERLSKARASTDWIWGVGLFGGIALAALASVAITRANSRAA